MKIVELISDLNMRAGAEVFATSLTNAFERNENDEVYLIFLWSNIHPSFVKYLDAHHIHYYCCGKNSSFDFARPIIKMKKILLDINPDIVHTHGSVLLSYFFAFRNRIQRWKLIHTFHNIAMEESNYLGKLSRKIMSKKKRVFFVGISNRITKTIIEYYKIDRNYVSTIYNGVELRNYESNSTTKKEFDFVCVARFEEQKNHLMLLKAVDILRKDFPEIKIALVGEGSLMGRCEEYVRSKQMDKNVLFLGPLDDVYPILEKSKFFILTSIFEGNPISILEAISVGLPIVSSSVGGIPDVVQSGRNGLLFDSNDINELLSCMRLIISDKLMAETMRNNNIIDSKKYSMDYCASQYKDLFLKI